MSNRNILYLTGLGLLGIVILFAINIGAILSGHPVQEKYLRYNQVRGIAVRHNQTLYTLNFQQQNELITLFNESFEAATIKEGVRQTPTIDKIIVYQFNNKPDLIITPITYVDNDLIFSVPEWNPNGYLLDMSEGRLKKLLSQTYDP
jgi:hypothetical protein